MEEICACLFQEPNPAVVQPLCRLISAWVKRHGQVPVNGLQAMQNLPERMARHSGLEGGVARAWLVMLKVIAQVEAMDIDWSLLEYQVCQLLEGFDLMSIQLGEAEMIDLLGAIARHQPTFLQWVVGQVCPNLMRLGYRRNVSAVIKAIRRVEGTTSMLLEDILAATWCDQDVEGVVLDVKGIV